MSTAKKRNGTHCPDVYTAMKQTRRFCTVDYTPEEYSKFYIVQALFKLMSEYEYEKISVTDIAKKAGVGRVTFYRHFKNKEEVILYYFEHNRKSFLLESSFHARNREDYLDKVTAVFRLFRKNAEPLKLLRRARLEYIYLDYLNGNFAHNFREDYPEAGEYAPYLYAGMLFNISMAWLDNDCADPPEQLAKTMVDAIYPK